MHKNATRATSGARLKGGQDSHLQRDTQVSEYICVLLGEDSFSHQGAGSFWTYGIPQLTVRTETALNAAGA